MPVRTSSPATTRHNLTLTAALLGLLLAACGSDDEGAASPDSGTTNDTGGSTDAGVDVAPDAAVEEDVATVGDVSTPPDADENACPQVDLIEAWPLVDDIAIGSVETEAADASSVVTIDAAAGGSAESRNNAFVYLDLNTGEMVRLTDLESLIDTEWQLAFRRTNLRLNSGDSGPGTWEMTKVSETTFDAVTTLPDDANWQTDVTFESDCDVIFDPINNPFTAINYLNIGNESGSSSWYFYGGEAGVSPVEGDVYIIRDSAGDTAYKFVIESWVSGVYTLRYAPIAP
jgi:hypothetical protein